MPISAITHLQTIIYNVLLVKIKGPVWYTIYHQTNRLFKGFVQARLLINQPIGKGHLCHMISAMISTKKNKHISNHIYFICGVLSLTIILSESYTYQPDEVCPFSIDIPPYINIYIYTIYYSICYPKWICYLHSTVLQHLRNGYWTIYIYQWPFQEPKMEVR